MFGSVAFCHTLVLITMVASIPTNLTDFEPVVIVDVNSQVQNAFETHHSFSVDDIYPAEVECTFRYSIGKRISNDRIVSQNADSFHWTSPQNLTLILQYPTNSQGAVITNLELVINQSSNIGGARVIAGGIGERFIASIVEANDIIYFKYLLHIYGI